MARLLGRCPRRRFYVLDPGTVVAAVVSDVPSVSSRLPAPDGYYLSLEARRKHDVQIRERLFAVLQDALLMYELDAGERATLQRAAELAAVALSHGGIDLVFDADGHFKYVVT